LGAMAGAAYGVALKSIFPFLPISPPVFALAGMAGMVCGSTGAAITALVMVFEMTLDYSAVLPLTVTVATSNGIRAFLSRETILHLETGPALPFYAKCPEDRFPAPEAGWKRHETRFQLFVSLMINLRLSRNLRRPRCHYCCTAPPREH